MEKQIWFCRVCKKRGSVEMESNEGLCSAIYKLQDAHRATSPDCSNSNIQVVNEGLITPADMAKVMELSSA